MKRKLFLGLAALAALTITSCQKDLVINQVPEEQPIGFGTYVGRDAQTKASIIDNAQLVEDNFGVFGYYYTISSGQSWTDLATTATPNFMYNQLVDVDGTSGAYTYSYSPVKYWPNNENDRITFFAYSPYDYNGVDSKDNAYISMSDNTASNYPTITYTVDEDVTKQVDLMWATPVKDQYKEAINKTINFNFNHALSRVGFKVEAVFDESTGKANGATDEDNQNKDQSANTTITVDAVDLIANNAKFYSQGTLNLENGNWTLNSTDKTVEKYSLTTTNFSTEFTGTGTGVTETPTLLNDTDDYLMILPVDLSADTDKIKIRVKYTVTTTDTQLNGTSISVENDITSDAFGFNFQQGKAYNFVLHLGLTSVKVSATVSNWDTQLGTDIVVNVPNNN